MINKIKHLLSRDYLLSFFIFLSILLSIIYPYKIKDFDKFIDWKTISVLFGLLLITTAIKESHFLRSIALKRIKQLKTERTLAFYLIFLTAIVAMFLTNDIALFIVVPLTLSFQEFLHNDLNKIVIFEAIAANVGSALTPIGNPQNLFIWQQSGLSFSHFIALMFPLFAILFCILILFTFISFPSKALEIKHTTFSNNTDKKLLYTSITIFILFIICTELDLQYISVLIFLFYLIFYRSTIKHTDYLLLILFILMFIDFHLISEIPAIHNFFTKINLTKTKPAFIYSLSLSQIMSNVPASIFISNFSHNWKAIAYGVNIGGNGIIIGSLANLIALRFINDKKIYLQFHKYSLLFLSITALLCYFLFFF